MDLATTTPCVGAVLARTGTSVVLIAKNGIMEIWDWTRPTTTRELPFPANTAVPIAFLGDGTKLLIARGREQRWSTIEEWSVETGERTRVFPIPVLLGAVRGAVSPDQRKLLVSGLTVGHAVIDLASGQIVESGELGAGKPAFSADGTRIAIASSRGITEVRSLVAGKTTIATLRGFVQGMHGAAFSPYGDRLAVQGGGFEAVKIFDMANWETLLTLEGEGTGNATITGFTFSFSPNGKTLGIVYGPARTLHLWRAPSWAA